MEFAKQLSDLGFKILASGGTAKELISAGIEVTDVASLVGGGPILGHRVVTLSREIHAGLLARDIKEDRDELEKLKVPFIDLVCVDLYPLQEEIAKWEQPLSPSDALGDSPLRRGEAAKAAVLEKTDIGGPTMLRSAAKGRRIVVCDPDDRMKVVEWLKNGEPDREQFISSLAAKAEAVAADYCLVSARYHSSGKYEGMVLEEILACKYGENAYQTPAGLFCNLSLNPSPQEGRGFQDDPLSLANFKVVAGSAPSYNNLADVDRLLQTITHIAAGFDVNGGNLSPALPSGGEGGSARVPMIAVGVKHGNPCGAAVSDSPSEAIQKMLEGDLRAIFGGLVMVNFAIDEKLAEILLTHRMAKTTPPSDALGHPSLGKEGKAPRRLLDGIIAPEFTLAAIEMLKRKGDKCRFLVNPALSSLSKNSIDNHRRLRYVRGGMLVQPNYTFILDFNHPSLALPLKGRETAVIPPPLGGRPGGGVVEMLGKTSEQQKSDLLLAWAIGSSSNSNTVAIVKDGMLLGNGVGQQDRVGCCQLAIKRATDAGHDVKGAAAYSDSFFPFVDGPETLANAGISAIFATSGSVKDPDVKKFCADRNVSLYMVPDSEARGFFGH